MKRAIMDVLKVVNCLCHKIISEIDGLLECTQGAGEEYAVTRQYLMETQKYACEKSDWCQTLLSSLPDYFFLPTLRYSSILLENLHSALMVLQKKEAVIEKITAACVPHPATNDSECPNRSGPEKTAPVAPNSTFVFFLGRWIGPAVAKINNAIDAQLRRT